MGMFFKWRNEAFFLKKQFLISGEKLDYNFTYMYKEKITILTCGTAGHVFPALVLAEYLVQNQYPVTLILDKISGKRYENLINKFKNPYLQVITTTPFKNKILMPITFFVNIFQGGAAIMKASSIICFVAGLQIPLLCWASLWCKKFFLHEQDSILNKTNGLFKYFASNIFTSFKEVEKARKYTWVGCPIKSNYRGDFKVEDYCITILAGTNGSRLFDQQLIHELIKLENIQKYTIYHNCRRENISFLEKFYTDHSIKAYVSTYFENFEELIIKSTFLITRSGASTIAYLAMYKKKAIIIPWGHSSQNHQIKNGILLEQVAASIVLQENQIHLLIEKIQLILDKFASYEDNFSKVFKTVDAKKYMSILFDN